MGANSSSCLDNAYFRVYFHHYLMMQRRHMMVSKCIDGDGPVQGFWSNLFAFGPNSEGKSV